MNIIFRSSASEFCTPLRFAAHPIRSHSWISSFEAVICVRDFHCDIDALHVRRRLLFLVSYELLPFFVEQLLWVENGQIEKGNPEGRSNLIL